MGRIPSFNGNIEYQRVLPWGQSLSLLCHYFGACQPTGASLLREKTRLVSVLGPDIPCKDRAMLWDTFAWRTPPKSGPLGLGAQVETLLNPARNIEDATNSGYFPGMPQSPKTVAAHTMGVGSGTQIDIIRPALIFPLCRYGK